MIWKYWKIYKCQISNSVQFSENNLVQNFVYKYPESRKYNMGILYWIVHRNKKWIHYSNNYLLKKVIGWTKKKILKGILLRIQKHIANVTEQK